MPRVILTGGPGAGKTTLLVELAAMGHGTVGDSARTIITDRLARGESPRPAPLAFAREIFRLDEQQYASRPDDSRWTFFDRGLVDALGMLHEAVSLSAAEITRILGAYPYHPTVFVLPPWEEIYVTDAQRDQSYEEAVHVHDRVVRWYTTCGYRLDEVPRVPVAQRAAHVMRVLTGSETGTRPHEANSTGPKG